MNWEALGAIGEIVGAVAVVLTLGYLAVQIRQNTEASRAGTHQAMVDGVSPVMLTLSESPDLARIVVKAHSDYDSLTPDERLRFWAYASRLFGTWENVFFQHREGFVAADMWEAWDKGFSRLLSGLAYVRLWEEEKGRFLQDFQQYVEGKRSST